MRDAAGNATTSNPVAVTVNQSEVQVLGSLIGVGLSDTGSSDSANMLVSSQSFTSVEWTTGLATVTDNAATAPDSSVTAAALTETTGTNTHYVQQGVPLAAGATKYTCGVSVKPGLRSRVLLNVTDVTQGKGAYIVFDVAGGKIGVAATTYGLGWSVTTGSSPTPEANGYYHTQITFTTPISFNSLIFAVQGDSGTGTSTVSNHYAGNPAGPALYLWGAQCEPGTSLSTYGPTVNNGIAATTLTSGSLTNFWGTQTPNAWIGIDAGQSVQWTRYRFAPRPGSASPLFQIGLDYEALMQGNAVQTCTDSTCSSPSTIDTIPSTPYYARFDLSERTISASSQYIRMLPASASFGSISQLQFFAYKNSIGNAQAAPVSPTISPWGGRFPSASTTVTLSSLTSDAQIYYTTDGTQPSNTHGTLYTRPFTYAIGAASTTVQAVTYDPTLSTTLSSVASATFEPWGFIPDDNWYDNNGTLIEAHDGSIIYVNGLYYWIGSIANKFAAQFFAF